MRILDLYIGRTITASTVTVLFTLIGVFSFFGFIDELESIGVGDYGIVQAVIYVLLSIPSLTYELLPMAALIGSLLGLGTLMRNSEIIVARAAGVSKFRLVISVLKAAVVFVVIAVVIGELISPVAVRYAHDYRNLAKKEPIFKQNDSGFWAREDNNYINVRRVLSDDEIEDVYIYEFDAENILRVSTHARRAHYGDGKWRLEDITQTVIDDTGISQRKIAGAAWDSKLEPELISIVAVLPERLSIWELVNYINYLQENGQDTLRYSHALWVKITYPLAAAVMVFLAIPMVLRGDRSAGVGSRILLGGAIGLGFHLVNQAAGHLGVVFELPPILSAGGPTLVVFLLSAFLLLRTP